MLVFPGSGQAGPATERHRFSCKFLADVEIFGEYQDQMIQLVAVVQVDLLCLTVFIQYDVFVASRRGQYAGLMFRPSDQMMHNDGSSLFASRLPHLADHRDDIAVGTILLSSDEVQTIQVPIAHTSPRENVDAAKGSISTSLHRVVGSIQERFGLFPCYVAVVPIKLKRLFLTHRRLGDRGG